MSGRGSFASHYPSSQNGNVPSVENPTQYTTTLHILDPEPIDIAKPAQMAETYASFDDTYNVKTNFIRRIYSLLCIQLALTCMMCYLFYNILKF